MKKKISSSRYIVIVGCGRLGSHLANELSLGGDSLVVIDKWEGAFSKLDESFSGFTIEADATELEEMHKAKVDQADVFVAVTNDDNTNIMLAQMAKSILGVEKVIARLFDPSRQRTYEELGVETISPMVLSARAFKQSINEGR
jgi:trk system potassium uptake protein TrkA